MTLKNDLERYKKWGESVKGQGQCQGRGQGQWGKVKVKVKVKVTRTPHAAGTGTGSILPQCPSPWQAVQAVLCDLDLDLDLDLCPTDLDSRP